VGPPFSENRLLAAGHAFEQALGFTAQPRFLEAVG
jgi:Asp-tRNA(Asn)/Glu-tRNA(Gln) amidotransferase A subunit family amidase